jgi:hypothetical protein
MRYTTVVNFPNRTATVHKSDCVHLGNFPAKTESSERPSFDDGFDALKHGYASMPKSVFICGHCLKEIRAICRPAN